MKRLLVIAALALVAAGAVFAFFATREEQQTYQVRAIFDSAFSIIEQEDVKVAGVTVGKIKSLDVTPDNKAAVVMDITEPGFKDFRQDAKCTIRPQSLIGEKYIECTLTEVRPRGERQAPPLRVIEDGPGEGQRLLPVERTSRPVDLDLLNNITRLPQRQRLAIILNELGAGLGGRGEDLDATIRRANPALRETNDVLQILGDQNEVLRDLATNSDRVLAPLARDRGRVASFIENANSVSTATAERRADLERVFERLPRFIEELRPTMLRLGQFSDEFSPALRDLQAAAPDINRLFRELGPFSQAGIPALRSLGEASEVGRPALVRSKPIIDDIGRLANTAAQPALDLRRLTESFQDTGGVERAMDYIFYQVAAINGYDSLGHYLRAGLIVNNCTQYRTEPLDSCSSNFASRRARDDARAAGGEASAARTGSRKIPARLAKQTRRTRSVRPRTQQRTLRMPRTVLPGQDPSQPGQDAAQPAPAGQGAPTQQQQPAPQQGAAPPQDDRQQAQDGLLDYLLGGS